MRDVKFRAWNRAEKFFQYCDGGSDHDLLIFFKVLHDYNDYEEKEQFTGLKDKNDNEIYEGDIIEYRNSIENGKGVIVPFLNSTNLHCEWFEQNTESPSLFTSLDYLGCSKEIEIIGNIHQDTGLLEK